MKKPQQLRLIEQRRFVRRVDSIVSCLEDAAHIVMRRYGYTDSGKRLQVERPQVQREKEAG